MSTEKHPALEQILFISIPEDWNRTIEGFTLNPAKLLPVEVPAEDSDWALKDLSWEGIISAMLKILAYDQDHEDTDYYREFIMAVKPDLVAELSETGVLKARNGDYALAEEIFRALTGLEPENALQHMNLALVCEQRAQAFAAVEKSEFQQEYLEEAFSRYKALFSMDEVPVAAHINAGFFYAKQRCFDQALHHLHTYVSEGDDESLIDKAAKLLQTIQTQNLQDTRFKEAYDFIAMGQEERGIHIIKEFLAENPKVWNGWFLLGWGLRKLQRYQDAITAFEKAAELHNEQADTYNELSICYMESGRMDEARSALESALSLEPTNTKIISNLGILALKNGDLAKARGFFHAVQEYEPDDPVAQRYLEYLDGV